MKRMVGYRLATAAVYAAIRLIGMKNVADLMKVSLLNPRIHKVDFGGIIFRAESVINT